MRLTRAAARTSSVTSLRLHVSHCAHPCNPRPITAHQQSTPAAAAACWCCWWGTMQAAPPRRLVGHSTRRELWASSSPPKAPLVSARSMCQTLGPLSAWNTVFCWPIPFAAAPPSCGELEPSSRVHSGADTGMDPRDSSTHAAWRHSHGSVECGVTAALHCIVQCVEECLHLLLWCRCIRCRWHCAGGC